jgi:hypothetical protein
MILLQATVKATPRHVTTRYGDRVVIDAIAQGREITIWRGFPDSYSANLRPGTAIAVTQDSKGKYSLVEESDRAQSHKQELEQVYQAPSVEPVTENRRSAEIADYVGRLSKLYSHCYRSAATEMAGYELEPEDTRAIATTLFLQTVKKFDL